MDQAGDTVMGWNRSWALSSLQELGEGLEQGLSSWAKLSGQLGHSLGQPSLVQVSYWGLPWWWRQNAMWGASWGLQVVCRWHPMVKGLWKVSLLHLGKWHVWRYMVCTTGGMA